MGSDALIPCTFTVDKPPVDPKYFAVFWYFKGNVTLSYDDVVETQDPRFSLNTINSLNGDASLSISSVMMSDKGAYTCSILYSPERKEKEVTLYVQAAPVIKITGSPIDISKESVLTCNITRFYPENIDVKWFKDGVIIDRVSVSKPQRNPDGTYSVTSTVTTTPTEEDGNHTFSCRVQHESLPQPLQENFQLEHPDKKDTFLPIILGIAAAVIVLIVCVGAYLAYRFCKGKEHRRKVQNNGEELVPLTGVSPPHVEDIEIPDQIQCNQEVTLRCNISRYPKNLTVTWLKYDPETKQTAPVDQRKGYKTPTLQRDEQQDHTYISTARLVFTPSYESDDGAVFTCRVEHPSLKGAIERRTKPLHVTGRHVGRGAGTSDGRDAGTSDGRGAGTSDRRGAGTSDGRGAGTSDRRGAGTSDGRGAGTSDGRGAGTSDGRGAGTSDGRGAGTSDGRGAGTSDGRGAGTSDGRGAGTSDGRGAGTSDGRGAGTPDGRGAGTSDGRGAGTSDGRGAGTSDGRGAGTSDGRGAGTSDGRDAGMSDGRGTKKHLTGPSVGPGNTVTNQPKLGNVEKTMKENIGKTSKNSQQQSIIEELQRVTQERRLRQEGTPQKHCTPASHNVELSPKITDMSSVQNTVRGRESSQQSERGERPIGGTERQTGAPELVRTENVTKPRKRPSTSEAVSDGQAHTHTMTDEKKGNATETTKETSSHVERAPRTQTEEDPSIRESVEEQSDVCKEKKADPQTETPPEDPNHTHREPGTETKADPQTETPPEDPNHTHREPGTETKADPQRETPPEDPNQRRK
uniref:Ig-like domain-containing protein n=1 Tax=Leptobrachium leishanense TaxID=445787 RepID=A0A8C5WCV4_9ANUR